MTSRVGQNIATCLYEVRTKLICCSMVQLSTVKNFEVQLDREVVAPATPIFPMIQKQLKFIKLDFLA